MLHARFDDHKMQETDSAEGFWYCCVHCGARVEFAGWEFLEWLRQSEEVVYCQDCDPLPELLPDALFQCGSDSVFVKPSDLERERGIYSHLSIGPYLNTDG